MQQPVARARRACCASLTLLVGVLAFAGCGASGGDHARLTVESGDLVGSPISLRLAGLTPDRHVALRATMKDAHGVAWSSAATFAAGSDGTVAPAHQAPVAGSYAGVDPDGLIWSMRSRAAPDDSGFVIPSGGEQLKIVASADGKTLVATTVTRRKLASGVTSRDLRPRTSGGLYGRYFAPPAEGKARVAVLIVGGSGGGLPALQAALFAAHGHPSLALAYFGEPGLPAKLHHVPLEYFAHALRWLAKQPGVDPRHVVFDGVSRGTEAALLVAAHFPKLVSAVVALVPSNVVVGAFPWCAGGAWTLHGRELPYQCRGGPTADPPDTEIPIRRFPGPLFLACGGDDLVWRSCPMAHALLRRHHAKGDTLLAYPDAGHGVGFPVPGVPVHSSRLAGGTPGANADARRQLWPRLLNFIDAEAS